jgi:hypothetical protein
MVASVASNAAGCRDGRAHASHSTVQRGISGVVLTSKRTPTMIAESTDTQKEVGMYEPPDGSRMRKTPVRQPHHFLA